MYIYIAIRLAKIIIITFFNILKHAFQIFLINYLINRQVTAFWGIFTNKQLYPLTDRSVHTSCETVMVFPDRR